MKNIPTFNEFLNEDKSDDEIAKRIKELEKEIHDIYMDRKEGKIIPLDKERKRLVRQLKTGTSSYIHRHGPNKGKPIERKK